MRQGANLRVGAETCERAARILEQQLGAVWAAVLETHGYDPALGYRLVVDGLAVAPAPPNGPDAADATASAADGQAVGTLPVRGG
jgi:hypothetical protein